MQITTIGLDLAKNVFQVHGANERGKTVLRKQLRREQVVASFANLPSCLGWGRPSHCLRISGAAFTLGKQVSET